MGSEHRHTMSCSLFCVRMQRVEYANLRPDNALLPSYLDAAPLGQLPTAASSTDWRSQLFRSVRVMPIRPPAAETVVNSAPCIARRLADRRSGPLRMGKAYRLASGLLLKRAERP